MSNYVTLSEAATFLGVSKATLRNWDKEGKLKAIRHPMNRYRVYDLDELKSLKNHIPTNCDTSSQTTKPNQNDLTDPRDLKRAVARLHSILRDSDGDSNIIQRFDELTKLLFLKLFKENDKEIFIVEPGEDMHSYAHRIRNTYIKQSLVFSHLIPHRFRELNSSDASIFKCGLELSNLTFSNIKFDVKGVAYEEIIKGTFNKTDNQQFFTPYQIVNFMVSMMAPYIKGTVADPACGTAGFLVEIARRKLSVDNLIGLEIDERLSWVSGINLLLHGATKFDILYLEEGGTLGHLSQPYIGMFNAILTNPPFGSDFSDETILNEYILGRHKSSRRRGILFIERCWELLKPDGVVAIIIDEGVLNQSSSLDVRKFILEHFNILAIINLPETAFMPYATVNASILLLQKTFTSLKSQSVFFGKAEKIGRKINGDDDVIYEQSGIPHLNSDLPNILDQWDIQLKGLTVLPSEFVFIANVAENLENDESLRLDYQYHHPSRNRSRVLLDHSIYPLYTLADLCDERIETSIPSVDMCDEVILYTGLANIESNNGVAHQIPTPAASIKSGVKRYEPGDIVFALMRPGLRKVALMNFNEGGYISPECTVFTVRKNSDGNPLFLPEVLAAILRSDLVFGQILHLITGIGRPRLSIANLRRVLIPLPPYSYQVQGKVEYECKIETSRQLRTKANMLIQEADSLDTKAVHDLAKKFIEG